MKTTAVIIARFQTPFLHEGHLSLLDDIRSRHNKVVIVLGVSQVKGSSRNPYDFYTREIMLKQYAADLVVLPLSDHSSDAAWSQNLDKLLSDTFPKESFILYGSRDCFIPFYSGRFPVAALPAHGSFSASELRERFSDKVMGTEDFRMGINYAYQNLYPRINATVDIAVIREERWVLLGRKSQAAQWRFPGGFSDPEDDSFEAAALRELREECGAVETAWPEYIASVKVDDWRFRNETDKIISTFFKASYTSGTPAASDDLVAVEWFPLNGLQRMIDEEEIVAEHRKMVTLLLKSLERGMIF